MKNQASSQPRRRTLSFGLLLACGWLIALCLLAVFADALPLHDPIKQNYASLNAGPSAEFLMGTDSLGRDMFSRLAYGARISLVIGILSPLLALGVGLALGLLGGFFGGWLDYVLGVFTDTLMAFPNIVLATVVVAFLGGSLPVMVCVIAFYSLPRYIRVSRANTILFGKREFVTAASAQGASNLRIIIWEILPNVIVPVATLTLTLMSFAILIEGGLSFLGVGTPPPTATWGGMIADGINDLPVDPKISLLPAFVIFLTILSFNVVGEHFRKRNDIRSIA